MAPDALVETRFGCARGGEQTASRGMLTAATLLGSWLCLTLGVAHADVATPGDVVACNREAREGVWGRAAFPTLKDEAGADDARKASRGPGERLTVTGEAARSADPQIDGMDAEGAKDAVYRAAYRVCMRKKGF